MNSSTHTTEWISVSNEWNAAALELRHAVEADCQASSASRDAFTPALRAIGAVVAKLKGAQQPLAHGSGTMVLEEWRLAVKALIATVRHDATTSSASRELFGAILDRLDGIEPMTSEQQTIDDAMTGVRDFLNSGRALDLALTARHDPLSEGDVTKVLDHAVKMHDAPPAPAPIAKLLAWVVDAEDDCVETATTPFGFYTLQVFPKGCAVNFSFGTSGRRVFEVMGSTREQGAAAAQADFAKRVQECMSTDAPEAKDAAAKEVVSKPVLFVIVDSTGSVEADSELKMRLRTEAANIALADATDGSGVVVTFSDSGSRGEATPITITLRTRETFMESSAPNGGISLQRAIESTYRMVDTASKSGYAGRRISGVIFLTDGTTL